jgi:hypothetical protein
MRQKHVRQTIALRHPLGPDISKLFTAKGVQPLQPVVQRAALHVFWPGIVLAKGYNSVVGFERHDDLQARLDALEDGVDEDALAVGDDDDEFEMEDELDLDGKGDQIQLSIPCQISEVVC